MFALASRSFSQTSETFVRQHAARIAPGRSVFLTFDHLPDPPLPGPVLAGLGGFPVEIRPDGGGSRGLLPLGWLPAARDLATAGFLRRHGVGVMMAEFGPFAGKFLRAARRSGVRLYVHFHGWDASRALGEPGVVAGYRHLWTHAAGFFAPSRFLADRLVAVGCPADRLVVCPCGVDPDDFPVAGRVPGRCIMIGRMVPKKAPLHSIAAFAQAAAADPGATLDVVGDGELLGDCRDLVARHGLGGRVTLHGALPHARVRELMGLASIFLQHSVTTPDGNTEGLPCRFWKRCRRGCA
jgi:glycosyltransferase involved in cell wall biosynthesis